MTFAIVGSVCAPGIPDGRSAAPPSASICNSAETDFLRVFARHRRALGTRPYIHHIAGRVRLRAEPLKQNPDKLDAIRAEFEAIAGVRSALANRLTGSIVVDYDSSVLPPNALSAALRRCGFATAEDNGAGLTSWADHISAKAIEWLLEKLAIALIAAVV